MEVFIGWQFLQADWLKFSSDGSVRENDVVGCGGVCRDEAGSWCLGFSRFLGFSSITMAEL